jgi:hypothetical protein
MESMLMMNTSNIIITDAQQEKWMKDQKRLNTLPSRIFTENNSSKSSMYKHKPLPTPLQTCDILAPAINLASFSIRR